MSAWSLFDEDAAALLDFKGQRKAISKEKLDIFNRLHSLFEDSQFVEQVARSYSQYPLVRASRAVISQQAESRAKHSGSIANQRCGAWYCDPEKSASEVVYFKSTDGHAGQWQFSLRRSNLQLIKLIWSRGGVIIVDSTRRGKRFPDALSKTVPAWCATLNACRKATQADFTAINATSSWEEHGRLCTLPSAVGRSEHDQMEALVGQWTKELMGSSFDLTQSVGLLDKPLRPIFVSPSSTLDAGQTFSDFYPVFCVSASKLLDRGDSVERSGGYTYVQGSGDDHEAWSQGLTPTLFWKHKEELLQTDRRDLPELVASLVNATAPALNNPNRFQIRNTSVSLCVGCTGDHDSNNNTLKIVVSDASQNPDLLDAATKPTPNVARYEVPLRSGKHILKEFSQALPNTTKKAAEVLRDSGSVLVCCSSMEKDIRDSAVGIVVCILEEIFDEHGSRVEPEASITHDKSSIRHRLQWVIEASQGTVNPSRSILQRVNSHFLSRMNER